MKTIKLEKELIKNAKKKCGFDSTADMLEVCLRAGGIEGVSYDQLVSRLKISELLDNAKDSEELSLEDADALALLERVKKMIWAEFTDDTAKFVISMNEQLK